VTPSPEQAVERLEELERLFDHARCHLTHDALALGEIFDQARLVLDELAASNLEHADGPGREAIIEAAERAQQSHAALSHAIGIEVARIGRDLKQLSKGRAATSSYAAAAYSPLEGRFNRSR
jgi:hypothetical protein